MKAPGKPLDEPLLRADLHRHVAAGVTMIRAPGLAGNPPDWFGRDGDVPRAVHAGPWIAQQGQFFDGWGRRASHAELPQLAAATVHAQLAAAAAEAGVTILAGTDSRPCGRVIDEIRALVAAGVPPHHAIGAASWTARSYLGLAGLAEGAPADVVVYDADPRSDLGQLAAPRAVVLRGRIRYRRS